MNSLGYFLFLVDTGSHSVTEQQVGAWRMTYGVGRRWCPSYGGARRALLRTLACINHSGRVRAVFQEKTKKRVSAALKSEDGQVAEILWTAGENSGGTLRKSAYGGGDKLLAEFDAVHCRYIGLIDPIDFVNQLRYRLDEEPRATSVTGGNNTRWVAPSFAQTVRPVQELYRHIGVQIVLCAASADQAGIIEDIVRKHVHTLAVGHANQIRRQCRSTAKNRGFRLKETLNQTDGIVAAIEEMGAILAPQTLNGKPYIEALIEQINDARSVAF